ncbi:MAG: hypothetical protein JW881_13725 [Spirochaetales bacterium]|nr:hypothetical protein [Spirochaetales bacterium]
MKIVLDPERLLEEGKIDKNEYDKLHALGAKSTSSLAFNLLLGFGVIAVSLGSVAFIPTEETGIIVGLVVLCFGIGFLRTSLVKQWKILAYICVLVGSLISGGATIMIGDYSPEAFLIVAAVFLAAGIFSKSGLLVVLAVFAGASSIGARTGYFHAMYFLGIREPGLTVVVFTAIAIGFYHLSKVLPADYAGLAIAASRTSVFLVNFGFWIGSLWGDDFNGLLCFEADDWMFAVLWALALLATGAWAWFRNRRWVVNIVAVFGGIHFYTQLFENLGANPRSLFIGGVFTLAFAVGLKVLNAVMEKMRA